MDFLCRTDERSMRSGIDLTDEFHPATVLARRQVRGTLVVLDDHSHVLLYRECQAR